jgi:hypothetical protein
MNIVLVLSEQGERSSSLVLERTLDSELLIEDDDEEEDEDDYWYRLSSLAPAPRCFLRSRER